MEPFKDWKMEEYENTFQTRYPIYNYEEKNKKNRANYISKISYSSKNNENLNKAAPKRRKEFNIENKTINMNSQNFKTEYNNYSYSSHNDEPRNSAKYYSKNNKYLTLFNSRTRRYDPSNATLSKDCVLRGYTDNCSFYISGSSDLNSKINIKKQLDNSKSQTYSKYDKNIQMKNKEDRQNKVYENRTQIINPSDYIKKEIKKDIINTFNRRNENKNYNSTANYKEKINYQSPILSENKIKNVDKNQNKYYSRRSYFETEPINIIKYLDHRDEYNNSFRKHLIPPKNTSYREPKPTIQNINIKITNNKRNKYKTYTINNFEEKKNNYYKTFFEKKSNQNQKRNNTPNISTRLENVLIHYITPEKEDSSKKIPNRYNNYKSIIPHNKWNRYKSNIDLEENILYRTERKYHPKTTLNRKNSNSNIYENKNKNRYNFPQRPKLREYGTKTEIHPFNNNYNRTFLNNNEKEKEYKITDRNNQNNYFFESKKIDNKNRYSARSVSVTPSSSFGKKYGVRTEIISINNKNNYSRNDEYEVTDIKSFKRQLQGKNNYIINGSINKVKNILNNKKEYNTFQKSLNNIKDNAKQIEIAKKNNMKFKQNAKNNHSILISNYSKDKKIYGTSTQTPSFRPHGFILNSLDEYEVHLPKKKYKKNDKYKSDFSDKNNENKDKYKILNINKNNYFNVMKNLEEELEIDDDEQIEYIPQNISIKTKYKNIGNKYSYDFNKSSKQKEDINNGSKKTLIIQKNKELKNINPKNNHKNREIDKIGKNINSDFITNKYKEKKIEIQYIPQSIQQNSIIEIQSNKKYENNKIVKQNIRNHQQKLNEVQKNLEEKQPNKIETQQLEEIQKKEENNDEDIHNMQENINEEKFNSQEEKDENNNLKKSKYSSYFGDFNNNYYEIKGVRGSGDINEYEEEEEENEQENEKSQNNNNENIQLVRNITFGIHSENFYIPVDQDDKEEKEADEQLIEEEEQTDENNENGEGNEKMEMEQIDEENEGEIKNENIKEYKGEGEIVGDEMIKSDEEKCNEKYYGNEMNEGEEIEENDENKINEEEDYNDPQITYENNEKLKGI